METRTISLPGGRIAYDLTDNDGPLVVCAPGYGDLRGEYRALVPQLVAAGFRVATMDLRGHGESSTGWDDHSAAALGADLVALVRHLGGRAFLVGTSGLAAASVWAAAEAPDAVRGLVLIGPFVRDFPFGGVARALFKLALADLWGASTWAAIYKRAYPSTKPDDFAAYRAQLRRSFREPGRLAALRDMMLASKAACEARIADVAAPTLVVMGTRDPDFDDPAGEAKRVAERLRGAAFLVDGAGHYPHAERPDVTGPRVVEFLREHARG
jgi:pimeloyl-ACP methyl ester carboxylesterase